MDQNPNNPFQGVKLEDMLVYLFKVHGWEGMARHVAIKCFQMNPSIKSSLTFLRKTPWARIKVEEFYLETRFAERDRAESSAAV